VTIPSSTINAYGWKFNLSPCEQSVNRPLTVSSVTYFGTNTPSASPGTSCNANLGIAKGYAVDFSNGNAGTGSDRSAEFVGGGMPASPVAGVAAVDGVMTPYCVGCVDTAKSGQKQGEGSLQEFDPKGPRYRSYWYIQTDEY
jgi:type IV pilus assembly protein PilY1